MKRAVLACVFLSFSAQAQTIINADAATAQPIVKRDDAGFSWCGVRVVASVVNQKDTEIYDFSVTADAKNVLGLLKAGKYVIPTGTTDIGRRKTVLPGPVSFWLAGRHEERPLVAQKVSASTDAGFALGISDIVPTAQVLTSIAHGEPTQIALSYKGQHHEQVLAFRANMSDDDRDALMACLNGQLARFQREVDAAE